MTTYLKSFKCFLYTIALGCLGGLLSVTGTGLALEEDWGLTGLFKLRGALETPPQVIIISIDRASGEILHLPDDPEKWPRSYYARLIDKINQQQPAIIAFNIYFGEVRNSEDDDLLAQSMAAHKNVLLSNYLKQYTIPSDSFTSKFIYERIIDPIAILDNAAIATAPFPLPKTSSTVKQFWTYKRSAGDIPTFPVTAFQFYVFKTAYQEILTLLHQLRPLLYTSLPKDLYELTSDYKTIEIFQKIQTTFRNDPSLTHEFTQLLAKSAYPAEKNRLILAWLEFINSAESLYLNHYGKTGSITSIPFYQALVMDVLNPALFQNKIVLVGYSEDIEPEKNQGFYTSLSAQQQSVSAIEIAATAVANLLENRWLKPLSPASQALLTLAWGILLMLPFQFLSYKNSITAIILASLAYFSYVYYQFTSANIWLPLAIPLLLSLLVMIMESVAHLIKIRKVSECYLPSQVFAKNARNPEAMNEFGTLMYGVCMATDAGQYTSLSETMRPEQLNVLMNQYYAQMFPEVKKYQGIITDVIGDAMLAVWAKPTINMQVKIQACQSALAIHAALAKFNQNQAQQLPTRLGMHYGEMRLGNVGAIDHFEYRAIGDTINTANRIEGLNKLLGTRILASAAVIEGLPGLVSREIGLFVLKGKTQALTIYELLPDPVQEQTLPIDFKHALELFKNRHWIEAKQAFQAIHQVFPDDGPSQFYINYLTAHLAQPNLFDNPNDPVVIHLGNITA